MLVYDISTPATFSSVGIELIYYVILILITNSYTKESA